MPAYVVRVRRVRAGEPDARYVFRFEAGRADEAARLGVSALPAPPCDASAEYSVSVTRRDEPPAALPTVLYSNGANLQLLSEPADPSGAVTIEIRGPGVHFRSPDYVMRSRLDRRQAVNFGNFLRAWGVSGVVNTWPDPEE